MASIKYNSNGHKGKITYNSDIVSGIVVLSLQEIEGIQLVPAKNKGIKLNFEKDGVFVDISVIVCYGYNVPEVAYRIQQTIKQMVESMTHYKIAKVDVHVQSVVFPEPKAEEETPENVVGAQENDPADTQN